tara:strand:+ start:164 stop:517 length:354 start_codon:yes stop_codon:yes gene_type:complete
MENEKRLKRNQLIYYLEAFDLKNSKPLGHLVDINKNGIALLSKNPIKTNSTFPIKLMFEEKIMGNSYLKLLVKSLWTKKDFNPAYHITGFELLNVSSKNTIVENAIIGNLISKLKLC